MTTEDAERILNQTANLNNRVLSLTEQVGKLHEILSNEYITEQESIKNTLPNLTTHLQELKGSTSNFDRFLENAHKYTEINELTPELLHTFIKRIEIGERPKKYSRSAPQEIVIHYHDIGILDDMPQ